MNIEIKDDATARAIKVVFQEREAQKRLGYGQNNDDKYTAGELAQAAACYARLAAERESRRDHSKVRTNPRYLPVVEPGGSGLGYDTNLPVGYTTNLPAIHLATAAARYTKPPPDWPFRESLWLPANQKRNLARAAALLIAELERLERLDSRLLKYGALGLDHEKMQQIEAKKRKNKNVPLSNYGLLYEDAYLTDISPNVTWTVGSNTAGSGVAHAPQQQTMAVSW